MENLICVTRKENKLLLLLGSVDTNLIAVVAN